MTPMGHGPGTGSRAAADTFAPARGLDPLAPLTPQESSDT